MINVYIDGACTNNGKPNAVAGYGIYFSENDPRNNSGRVNGKQTNNTGELTAFIKVHEILRDDIQRKKIIHIYIDSDYVIKCATTYGDKLKKNNWKTIKDTIPPNVDLVKNVYELYQESKICVRLHHIEAHTEKTDEHSLGNAGADRLACIATGQDVDNINKPSIIRLDWVSFHNKDEAKQYGAKWDINKKFWYIEEDNKNIEKLNELMKKGSVIPSENKKSDEKKHYIKVSYAKKGEAKAFGAKWDPVVKSWYYTDSITDDKKNGLLKLV